MRNVRLALLATAAGLAFTASAAQAEIAIATAGPMTGQYAAFGDQMKRGAEMAVQDINAAGGVLGEQLTLEIGDDACDPRQAVSVANDLVNAGVVFVAGHFCSGSSIPASQVYNEEGILQISPASTNPQLTEQGFENVFRVCGRDDQQGAIAGQYIADNYGDATIAILDDKSAYGAGLAEETAKALNAAGITEAVRESYTAGESDYSALVSRLKEAGVTVVYVGGYHTEAGLILRQAEEQGMDVQLISGDAMVTNEFWSITGPAGEGTLMTFGPDPRNFPSAQSVVESFKAQDYDPEGYTLYTYAAVQIFAQAAEAAGSTDLDAVVEQLKGNSYDTVIGPISFNDKGDIEQPAYVWYQWHDGSYAEVAADAGAAGTETEAQ